MTYAEEMGPLVREGIASSAIIDITDLLEASGWLHQNPNTTCSTCGGSGRVAALVAPSVFLPVVCPRCFGGGEIPYQCAN